LTTAPHFVKKCVGYSAASFSIARLDWFIAAEAVLYIGRALEGGE
jgi:hypothetical protein